MAFNHTPPWRAHDIRQLLATDSPAVISAKRVWSSYVLPSSNWSKARNIGCNGSDPAPRRPRLHWQGRAGLDRAAGAPPRFSLPPADVPRAFHSFHQVKPRFIFAEVGLLGGEERQGGGIEIGFDFDSFRRRRRRSGFALLALRRSNGQGGGGGREDKAGTDAYCFSCQCSTSSDRMNSRPAWRPKLRGDPSVNVRVRKTRFVLKTLFTLSWMRQLVFASARKR
jgi:hypothetical protein